MFFHENIASSMRKQIFFSQQIKRLLGLTRRKKNKREKKNFEYISNS